MNPFTSRFGLATRVMAWRMVRVMIAKPSVIVPSLLMPLFFFTAFAGGLSAVHNAPGFDYPNYTTFQFMFVILQSAAFGGVFTGFSIAADFETGFARRLLLANRRRTAIIGGYAVTALIRLLLTISVVTTVALIAGADITGSGVDVLGIVTLAVMLNFAMLLFAAGMAMRFRTLQAAPLIQLPAFLIIMTAPVYVPRELIEGWVGTAADFNPMTALLEAARNLVIGAPADFLLAAGVAAGLIAVMINWARTGLRRAEAAG
jgi:ABC-type multidrug transport system permease subunit